MIELFKMFEEISFKDYILILFYFFKKENRNKFSFKINIVKYSKYIFVVFCEFYNIFEIYIYRLSDFFFWLIFFLYLI